MPHNTHTIQDTSVEAFANVDDTAMRAQIMQIVNNAAATATKSDDWPTRRDIQLALAAACTNLDVTNCDSVGTVISHMEKAGQVEYIGKRLAPETGFRYLIVALPGTPKDESYKPAFKANMSSAKMDEKISDFAYDYAEWHHHHHIYDGPEQCLARLAQRVTLIANASIADIFEEE